ITCAGFCELRPRVARICRAMMDVVSEKLRSRDAPASTRRVALHLPKSLSGCDQQRCAAAPRGCRLHHFCSPGLFARRWDWRSYAFVPVSTRWLARALCSPGPRASGAGNFRYNLWSIDCAAPIGAAFRNKEKIMTIKVGDRLPAGSLSEYIEVETEGCTLGPNEFKIDDLTRCKKVVLFGLPGAFTPT